MSFVQNQGTNRGHNARTGRRRVIKGFAATTAAVAAVYVKPTLHTLGVPTALASLSTPPPAHDGKDFGHKPTDHGVGGTGDKRSGHPDRSD